MGKRSRKFEESRFGRCEMCGGNIPVEFYADDGDAVFCGECSTEYIIKSRIPLRLMQIEEDIEDDFYGVLNLD